LVEKAKGRKVILSSGSTVPINLRSPYDSSNIALLFGLKECQAKESVWRTGLSAIKHSTSRRNPNSSCVTHVDESSVEPQDKWLRHVLMNEQGEECKDETIGKQGSKRKKKRSNQKSQPPEKVVKVCCQD
jgi:hypothetical protein